VGRETYFDNIGLHEYDEGLKELANGRTHMFNALGRREIEQMTYDWLFTKMETCESRCRAFAAT
jgi:hypothetical protein